jgi:uncharacterized protein YggE
MPKLNALRMIGALASFFLGAIATQSVYAQQASPNPGPQIAVRGYAEVEIPPTQAEFSIGVVTSAPIAATASEDNARISKAVSEALTGAGLKREEIIASQLLVNPRWEWDEKNKRQKRSAFEATNMFQIKTEKLAQIGNFIDAALSAGATNASQVDFSAKDVDAARHQALSQAVASARSDAEAIAKAGGGALGELLLLSTEQDNPVSGMNPREMMVTASRRAPEPVSTEIVPSQIKITAQVFARWKFVQSAAPK